jgi:hypothetical protein
MCCIFFILISKEDVYTYSFIFVNKSLSYHISSHIRRGFSSNTILRKEKSPYLGSLRVYSVHKLLSSRLLSRNIKTRIYKNIILPVVLYGCETWSLTLREEHRLRVFKNRVLRRIFGPKRDEVTGGWRKLHNE